MESLEEFIKKHQTTKEKTSSFVEYLYTLMNKVVDGDFRKAEFEAIENIDEFALELNKYLEEKE